MNETGPEPSSNVAPEPVPFDPSASHHRLPRLRPIRAFAHKQGEQVRLGIADRSQISRGIVFAPPAAQAILPKLDGSHELDSIVTELEGQGAQGLTREMLEQFVAQLDTAGLLFGPRFDAMWDKARAEFDSDTNLPPAITAAIADAMVVQEVGQDATDEQKAELGPKKLAQAMDDWIDKALREVDNPSFDALPAGIVVPQIDYARAWINYAAIWGRLRVTDRPDRVLVLGSNNFGLATGVCGCDKGFQSPLGLCPLDEAFLGAIKEELGDDNAARFLKDRYDHEREHSIEAQVPWIQHCLGKDANDAYCPVVGVLVHDPAANNGLSLDGEGLDLQPCIDAVRHAIETIGGRTLVIASAALSHAGPAFGDRQALIGDSEEAQAARQRILTMDRELIDLLIAGKVEEMVASIAWQQNATRWNSTGALTALVKIVAPATGTVYGYTGAMDPQGLTMVSSAAIAFS